MKAVRGQKGQWTATLPPASSNVLEYYIEAYDEFGNGPARAGETPEVAARRVLAELTGIDAEGMDLRQGGRVARLSFDTPLRTAGEARKVLVALLAKARAN